MIPKLSGSIRHRPGRTAAALLLLPPLLVLCGCGAPPPASAGTARTIGLPGTAGLVPDLATAPALPPPAIAEVAVRPFHEPNDHAHRNYCGAGATEVLLSAWEAPAPDLETVARAAGLDPRSGETGARAVVAVNDPTLDPVTYMETPSAIAGYTGPDSRTITVAALWVAMRQFLTDSPRDPVNLIS